MIGRLKAITKSYFKLGWKNLPFFVIPISWVMAPFCIVFGYIFLEDYLMGVKESDYKKHILPCFKKGPDIKIMFESGEIKKLESYSGPDPLIFGASCNALQTKFKK